MKTVYNEKGKILALYLACPSPSCGCVVICNLEAQQSEWESLLEIFSFSASRFPLALIKTIHFVIDNATLIQVNIQQSMISQKNYSKGVFLKI